MLIRLRFGACRMLGILLGTLLLAFAGMQPVLAQPAPGKASPEEICKGCHEDYVEGYSATKHSTKADARTPANQGGCLVCHGDAALEHAKQGGGRGQGGVFGFNDPKIPADSKSAVCLNCHQGGKRIHWASGTHANRDVACSSCHTVHKEDKARDKLTQTEVCFSCHKEQRAQINRPSRHPIKEGKVVCSDCHNPHGSVGPKLMARDSVVETCYNCHMEKRGPFIWNHQPVTEDCSICHQPHGTIAQYLLKQRPPFLCQQCHEPSSHRGTIPSAAPVTGPPFAPNIGQEVVLARGCMNCHTNIHGSNNPTNNAASRTFRR